MLGCYYFLIYEYCFELPKQKRKQAGVDFVYEHKEEARAPRKNTGHGTSRGAQATARGATQVLHCFGQAVTRGSCLSKALDRGA
jgi:hypothetical protein